MEFINFSSVTLFCYWTYTVLFFIYSEIFILILAFFNSIISICFFFLFFIFLLFCWNFLFSPLATRVSVIAHWSVSKWLHCSPYQMILIADTLSGWKWKWESLSPVRLFCNPMDYMVHGILQARILEWVAFPFSRGSSQPRAQTQVSSLADRFFTSWVTREAQEYWNG